MHQNGYNGISEETVEIDITVCFAEVGHWKIRL